MATIANKMPDFNQIPNPIVWNLGETRRNKNFKIESTNVICNEINDLEDCTTRSISNEFVKNIQKFDALYKELYGSHSKLDKNETKTKLEVTLSQLLLIDCDAFSSELTCESSFFFTIKKNEYSYYIEQYLNNDDENSTDDFVLTSFDNNKLLYNFSGSIDMVLNKINTDSSQKC